MGDTILVGHRYRRFEVRTRSFFALLAFESDTNSLQKKIQRTAENLRRQQATSKNRIKEIIKDIPITS